MGEWTLLAHGRTTTTTTTAFTPPNRASRKRPRSPSNHCTPPLKLSSQQSWSIGLSNAASSSCSWKTGGGPRGQLSPRLSSPPGLSHAEAEGTGCNVPSKMAKVAISSSIQRRVDSVFHELDVLLHAERVNRRVMQRWSGIRTPSQEESSNYCTWGVELIRQGIEDGVAEVVSTMEDGNIVSAVDAAQLLVVLYLSRAEERGLPTSRRDMHEEILHELGNSWFSLLPKMTQSLRDKFVQLVSDMEKTTELVLPFRLAKTIALIDLSDLSEGTRSMLQSLLGPEVFNCDVYVCLWSIADELGGMERGRALATEFRLKSLDAEMWRALLKEEAQARQHGYDEEDEEDDMDYEEEEDQEGATEKKEEGVSVSAVSMSNQGKGRGQREEEEAEQQIKEESACPPLPHASTSSSDTPNCASGRSPPPALASGSPSILASPPPPCKNFSLQTLHGTLSSPPGMDHWDKPGMFLEDDEDGEEEDDEDDGSHTGPDAGLYADYFTKHRYQYRKVMCETFRDRVMAFLEGIDTPVADPTLFPRSRPLLHRVLMVIPAHDLSALLELVAVKFSFEETMYLVNPLLVEDDDGYIMSPVHICQAMDWAIGHQGGKSLPIITRTLLGLITAPSLLQRMARRAVMYGGDSLPFILRSLSLVPPRLHESEAMELGKLMGEHWSKQALSGLGHYLIVRSLQRQPSLSLYFALKKHVIDEPSGVQRVLELMDPSDDLSIGIRLAEGLTTSALDSLSYALISCPDGRAPDRAFFWFSFTVQGLKEGRLEPEVLSLLVTNENFKGAILGGLVCEGVEETKARQVMISCFTRLLDLAPTQPDTVVTACQLLLTQYNSLQNHRRNDTSMLAAVGNVLRAAGKTSPHFLCDLLRATSTSESVAQTSTTSSS